MPLSTYEHYKASTGFFLSWIQQASGIKCSGKICKIDEVTALVEALKERDFPSLASDIQSSFLTALRECKRAIRLRESISLRYDESSPSYFGHIHFISCLKNWSSSLREAYSSSTFFKDEEIDDISVKFNMFSVLSTDDDESDEHKSIDVEEISWLSTPVTESSSTTEVGVRAEPISPENDELDYSSQFSFEEDLVLQLYSFLNDLEDISEQVSIAWIGVKEESISVFTATIITTAAIEAVQSLSNSLQSNFPAIREHADLHQVICDHLPSKKFGRPGMVSYGDWVKFNESGCKKRYYTKGDEMYEMWSIIYPLRTWSNSHQDNNIQIVREGIFGRPYDEDTGDCILDWINVEQIALHKENSRIVCFLMTELALLRNTFIEIVHDEASSKICGLFGSIMYKFFQDRQVTTTLAFTVLCWLKSVIYIQGNSYVNRTVSWLKSRLSDMNERVELSLTKGHIKKAEVALHAELQTLQSVIRTFIDDEKGSYLNIYRHNPFGACALVLNLHAKYLAISCETFHITSRFRAFGHLYSALLDRKLLPPIPFLDDLLEVYKRLIFYPSRPSFGSFVTCYQLSSHLTATSVAAINGKIKTRDNISRVVKNRHSMHAHELSRIFKFTKNDCDDSKCPIFENAQSYAIGIRILGEVATYELLSSRVLSRDSLAINDELSEIFEEMTDLLERRPFYNHYILTGMPQGHEKESRQYRIKRAGEDSVMIPLIYLLDKFDPSNPSNFGNRTAMTGSRTCHEYIIAAANYIHNKFASYSVEERFFIFPASIDVISAEYGTADVVTFSDVYPAEYNSLQHFCKWMDRFDCDVKPLTQQEVNDLKADIRYDPAILGHPSLTDEKSLIFHHIVAGPHYNLELAQWMISMGVLRFERNVAGSNYGLGSSNLSSVAFAVYGGDYRVVQLILESDRYKSINIKSGIDEDSLAHIAAKQGHAEILLYLKTSGINLAVSNRNGKKFYEMTKNTSLYRVFKQYYDEYQEILIKTANYIPRHDELRQKETMRSQRVVSELGMQMQNRKYGKVGKHAQPQTSVSTPSEKQIEDAERAAKELLASLDAEEGSVGPQTRYRGSAKKGKKKR